MSEAAQTVRDVLARHEVSLSEDEVASALDEALARVPGVDAAPLTATEIHYLTRNAGESSTEAVDAWDPEVERARRAEVMARNSARLLGSAIAIDEAARLLGVDRSRISYRISHRTVFSYTAGGNRRHIPKWQFTADALLPGLDQIVPAIPARAHPLDVAALMMAPQPEFGGRTPVEHLAGGGDPIPVAELLDALDRW